MKAQPSGNITIPKAANWSSMYDLDAPSMALMRIAWIHADETFDFLQAPGGDSVLFVLCLKGKGTMEFTDQKVTLLPNNGLILNIQSGYHARSVSRDFRFVFLQIRGRFANEILVHQLRDRGHVFSVGMEVVSLCERIYDLAKEGWSYEREIRISCFLYDLSGLLLISRAKDETLQPSIEYITAHFDKPVHTEELAAMCYLGVSQYIKRFRTAYGCTPKFYINNFRVSKAKELLAGGTLPVEIIAQMVGFDDASYFTRLFKKMTGETPRSYRHSMLR